jgi:hypothetical protein
LRIHFVSFFYDWMRDIDSGIPAALKLVPVGWTTCRIVGSDDVISNCVIDRIVTTTKPKRWQ